MGDSSSRTSHRLPTRVVVAVLITLTPITTHHAGAQTTAASNNVPTFAGVTGDTAGVSFSWWAVKGATGYELLRTPDPRVNPTTVASVSSTTLGYREPLLVTGTRYYQLAAVLPGGARTTSAWFEYSPPTVNAAASGADVVVSWSGVKTPPPGGYEVWRTTNPRQRGSRVGAVDGRTLTYRDKQAAATASYYQVVAVGRGGTRASSAWFAFAASAEAKAAAALAARLAQELATVGIEMNAADLNELVNGMVREGTGAMEIAMAMDIALANLQVQLSTPANGVGDPPPSIPGASGGTSGSSPIQSWIASMIGQLSTGPNASLATSQILRRKLTSATKK
jgi:hypothetical protein